MIKTVYQACEEYKEAKRQKDIGGGEFKNYIKNKFPQINERRKSREGMPGSELGVINNLIGSAIKKWKKAAKEKGEKQVSQKEILEDANFQLMVDEATEDGIKDPEEELDEE